MSETAAFRVLLVDDEAAIRDSLTRYLTNHGLDVTAAHDAVNAREHLEAREFELVMTDISMPEVSGLDLLAQIKSSTPKVDVIMMTGYLDISFAIQAMRRGAYDFFTKPINFEKVLLTVERVREQQRIRADAERYHVLQREREMQTEMTICLARAAEERDRHNVGHGARTASWAVKLGKRLCYTPDKLERLRYAALLHDIGKIGIDDAILNKPGKLTKSEFRTMERHSEIGAYILKPSSIFRDVAPIVRDHHEHYDGSGYPNGIVGDAISLDARIVGLCDYFDAVTSVRPYREPVGVEQAIEELQAERGKVLDPMLVDLFVTLLREAELVAAG